jgi:hypothetical protein
MNMPLVFSNNAHTDKNDGNKVRGKISKSQYRPNQAKLINGKAYPSKTKMNSVEKYLNRSLNHYVRNLVFLHFCASICS